MKRVVVKAREVVADIKSGKTDAELGRKYQLSPKSLVSLKNQLLAKNLVTPEDLLATSKAPPSCGSPNSIDVKEFLKDFRLRPDDLFLMAKYSLAPRQLDSVYRTLINKQLLTEYEYEWREVKVAQLSQEPSPCEAASTMVATIERENLSGAGIAPPADEHGLPQTFFQDFSGTKIQRQPADLDACSDPENGRSVRSSPRKHTKPLTTVVEIVTKEFCPRCKAPKSRDTSDSCLRCGVVFSKVESKIGSVEK
jgi:hypothetical protein